MATYQPQAQGPGGVLRTPAHLPLERGEVRYTIRSGDNIVAIMKRFGLPAGAVLEATRPHHDLASIKQGRTLNFGYQRGQAHAVRLAYPIDRDGDVTLVAEYDADAWSARLQERVYDERVVRLGFEIESSLWSAAAGAGLRGGDIMRLAEIYQWDVDFNSEIRGGEQFVLVAEGLHYDGQLKKLGEIHAVKMNCKGEQHVAIRHVHADGDVGYFAPDGKARRRPFLRSPLAFSRVTSGFNARGRFHPVLKKRRPHYGTDFGAPTGTPIRAVGDGVVRTAGSSGGHGLRVRITHPTGHESGYSHMSKILVRKGQKVKQGQEIGRVGSTGLSTGPHCHYELKYKGKYLDPMKADLPFTEPLPRAEHAAFFAQRDRWLPLLEEAAP